MSRSFKLIAFVIVITSFGFNKSEEFKISKIGEKISDFKLKNIDNSIISLSDFKNAKGFMIVFTCNHCPFAKLYSKRLNALNKKYKPLKVPLLAINSMDSFLYKEESFELMQTKAKNDKFNFYYLQDATQSVGKNFGAKHTPQAYVIWKEENNWTVKYEGAIDDDGENPEKANSFISNAVDELLSDKKVTHSQTESFGCRIFYRKN